MEGTDLKDLKAELLDRPNVRKQYEALKPRYDIVQGLIARRNELALSQRKLARMVGMHQPAICRLERGDANMSVGTLFKVAEALDLDIQCKPRTAGKKR